MEIISWKYGEHKAEIVMIVEMAIQILYMVAKVGIAQEKLHFLLI
jgi:hypothetical protein